MHAEPLRLNPPLVLQTMKPVSSRILNGAGGGRFGHVADFNGSVSNRVANVAVVGTVVAAGNVHIDRPLKGAELLPAGRLISQWWSADVAALALCPPGFVAAFASFQPLCLGGGLCSLEAVYEVLQSFDPENNAGLAGPHLAIVGSERDPLRDEVIALPFADGDAQFFRGILLDSGDELVGHGV